MSSPACWRNTIGPIPAHGAHRGRPFIERLVGTIRRELLDQVPFWNASDLERKLKRFKDYYNRDRIHASLGGITPDSKTGAPSLERLSPGRFRWKSVVEVSVSFPPLLESQFATDT